MDRGAPGDATGRNAARSLHVRVSGRVQGVWFRGSTLEEANRLGLGGWVRNLPDGGVEARFEGPEGRLREILAWCRHGPRGARVDRVEEAWGPAAGEDQGFRIRR